jgi:hypothetical protein
MMPLFELRDRSPRLARLKFCLLSFLVVPLAPALSWELGRGATYDLYEELREGNCQSGYKKNPMASLRYVLKNGTLFEFQEWVSDGRRRDNIRELTWCTIVDESNWKCPGRSIRGNDISDGYVMVDGRLSIEDGNILPRKCPLLIKKR